MRVNRPLNIVATSENATLSRRSWVLSGTSSSGATLITNGLSATGR